MQMMGNVYNKNSTQCKGFSSKYNKVSNLYSGLTATYNRKSPHLINFIFGCHPWRPIEMDCCQGICGAPTTLQGYGID